MTSVTISCNPDQTIHWTATLCNRTNCPITVNFRSQLQRNSTGSNGWNPVATERGSITIAPNSCVTVEDDFCYVPDPNDRRIRVEFTSQNTSNGGTCTKKMKSPSMAPCPRTEPCPTNTPVPTETARAGELPFRDVAPNSAFFNGIMALSDAHVVSGYADHNFRPGNAATRAQMTKLVVLAFGLTADPRSEQHFSDVPADHPFRTYIETAASLGLISGYSDGSFRPYNDVTRGQVAKIIVLAAGYDLVSPSTPTFSDVAVGSTFYSYIETAYAYGILSGYSNGTFRPEAQATRGQICKLIYQADLGR